MAMHSIRSCTHRARDCNLGPAPALRSGCDGSIWCVAALMMKASASPAKQHRRALNGCCSLHGSCSDAS